MQPVSGRAEKSLAADRRNSSDSPNQLRINSQRREGINELKELTTHPVELTEEELQSLAWIDTVATRIAIPVTHIEKLLDLGYIQEGVTGPKVTDLGATILEREMHRKTGAE